ncbi:MAG: cellulase family glycosylhydrolase [Burkholderiaceae bacterium]|nr:cellulase family glycosylhydrolase [Burkholderiaceae bacterium]
MKLLQLLLVALALLLAGCGGDDGNTADNGDPTQRIYVLAAASGSAGAAGAGQDVTVTLSGVEPEVDWYSDRPERLTGDARTQAFIDADWRRVYGDVAPNALLQFHMAGGVHALFGSVRDMVYDGSARSLRLTLRVSRASDALGAPAGGFTRPVLTLLNNLEPPAEGSSFALAATRTSLAKDSNGNWRLELEGTDPNVLWMNNAPARSADVESLGQFVNLWPERFSQVLPNASVAGDPGDGDYDIMPLTLSDPRYDAASGRLSFAATLLAGPGVPDAGTVLGNAVLFVDAGARGIPSEVFAQTWRGVAYSAIPAKFLAPPTGAFFDSDTTADAFQALWGSKNGCGRNDLEAMAAQGINLVRLYDYNYQRGSKDWETGGNGHIAFLDKAQALGIKVIIPVSNYNFKNQDGPKNRPWDKIENTVTQIVASVKKNGAIHPAVHSFSIGNELDLNQDGETWATLIPKAVRVANLLHKLAPDHYMTVPISNGDEKKFYNLLREQLPAELYQNRFYNSVQTFKLKNGDDLKNNILQAYDDLKLGVPLVITELGTNSLAIGSVDAKVDAVVGQASAVREYMDANPQSLVKGFAIFEWQNANWKRDNKPDNTESTFGIHAYDGTLCQSKTGEFGMWNAKENYWASFHGDETYDVDKLAPLTSTAHPEGLPAALSKYFK